MVHSASGLTPVARCREGARTMPSPKMEIRLFVYSIPPPARLSAVIGHRVTSESIWGRLSDQHRKELDVDVNPD